MNVLAYSLNGMTFGKDEMIEDDAEVQKAMQALIDTGFKICEEISSSSHLAAWRESICTVWLHK